MSEFMTVTDARKNIYNLVDRAAKPGSAIALTHDGQPKVVMMSFDEYESWQETMEIMADPHLHAELLKMMKDIRAGKLHKDTISLEALKKKMKL